MTEREGGVRMGCNEGKYECELVSGVRVGMEGVNRGCER